jgi:hypothetical protein
MQDDSYENNSFLCNQSLKSSHKGQLWHPKQMFSGGIDLSVAV